MKTQNLATTLTTFAKLAEAECAGELRRLASVFSSGKEETVAARVRKMQRAAGHPATLKASLETIQAGFKGAGATKQATAIGTALTLFAGPGDATLDTFIAEIITPPPPPPPRRAARPPRAPQEPDHRLARELADELKRTVLDTGSFKKVVERLGIAKSVNTPTLAIIANSFLGNSKPYTRRKEAIGDIVKRQKSDARERARSRALNRLGV